MAETNELLTLAEAAALLRLRPSTLRAWRLSRRNLPFVKLSGKVLVRRADVEALIQRSLVPTREERL